MPWDPSILAPVLGFEQRALPYSAHDRNGLVLLDIATAFEAVFNVSNPRPGFVYDTENNNHTCISFLYDGDRVQITQVFAEPFFLAEKT